MSVVTKGDGELRIAYGEVYAPNRPDAQGEFMTAEEIRKMAHNFMRQGRMQQLDVMHNNKKAQDCCVVESFIAPDDSKDFLPGAWVVGVHIPDDSLWERVKKGEINGFSMESVVSRKTREVEVEIPDVVTGKTSKRESDGHEHTFYVQYDDEGNFKGGMTDVVEGHMHQIVAGTHTQPGPDGHTHRFSSVDGLQVIVND